VPLRAAGDQVLFFARVVVASYKSHHAPEKQAVWGSGWRAAGGAEPAAAAAGPLNLYLGHIT
jgi:hypothetical protein